MAVDPSNVRGVLREVAEEGAKEELHSKGSYSSQSSTLGIMDGRDARTVIADVAIRK